MRVPLKQGIYHDGERSSESAHTFNKISTYSNCFEEQNGSESLLSENHIRKHSLMAECYEAQRNAIVQVPVIGCALQLCILGTDVFIWGK